MTPEELEELRALVGRLNCTAYNENLAAILGAALEHIDQQATALDEAEALTRRNVELMNGYLAGIAERDAQIIHQTGISACRIEERDRLQKQIAALQEIAVEERACRLSSPETGAIPTVEHYNAMDPEGSMLEACHQLEEEHPEAFR